VRHPQHNTLATVIRGLAAEKSPACLLDTRGIFLFVNDAWERHALANGGAPGCLGSTLVGTSWLEHIRGDEVRRLHSDLLERALRSRGPHARPVIQVGESNTRSTAALVSTRFEVVPQDGSPLAIRIVHATLRERPIAEVYDLVEKPAGAYRDGGGEIVQCSCCRRVRDPAEPDRWDFVPALLAGPLAAAQTVCDLCSQLHYVPVDGAADETSHPLAAAAPSPCRRGGDVEHARRGT
jgi:hypothetical protein